MIWIGTSGFQYPEWKGSFYPAKLPTAKMLPFYAEHFSTTEINYSFYRIPSEKTLSGWAAATPDNFRFTLKAPKEITHTRKLQGAIDVLDRFCAVARTLESKLGVLLFQLPPFFKKDAAVLKAFLDSLPMGEKAAFEFRHPSWFDDEIFGALREHNFALCVAESEKLKTPVVATADYGYFRLRDQDYTAADLKQWAETIASLQRGFTDTYIYFKHEESGTGPRLAKELMKDFGIKTAETELQLKNPK